MQPTCSREPFLMQSGTRKHQTCPVQVSEEATGPEALQGWKRKTGCDTPRVQGVTLGQGAAAGRKLPGLGKSPALPCLQGSWAGGRASSVSPPQVRRQGLSPSLQGCPSLRAAKGAQRQKANHSKDQPCTQGGRPAQSRPRHPEGALAWRSPLPRGPFVLLFSSKLALAAPFHT